MIKILSSKFSIEIGVIKVFKRCDISKVNSFINWLQKKFKNFPEESKRFIPFIPNFHRSECFIRISNGQQSNQYGSSVSISLIFRKSSVFLVHNLAF